MGAPHSIYSNGKWSSATYASTKLRKSHFFQGKTNLREKPAGYRVWDALGMTGRATRIFKRHYPAYSLRHSELLLCHSEHGEESGAAAIPTGIQFVAVV